MAFHIGDKVRMNSSNPPDMEGWPNTAKFCWGEVYTIIGVSYSGTTVSLEERRFGGSGTPYNFRALWLEPVPCTSHDQLIDFLLDRGE